MLGSRTHVGRVSLTAPNRDALATVVPTIEDALLTTSWPARAAMGDAVLMIRKLDLGVIKRRPSRQAISALIATRLADMPLVWSALANDGHDAPIMAWPSKAASLSHAAIVISRSGQSGASLPWWVARVLVQADIQSHATSPRIIQAIERLITDAGQGALIEVLNVLSEHGTADLAAKIAVHVLDDVSLPDYAPKRFPNLRATATPSQPSVTPDVVVTEDMAERMMVMLIHDLPDMVLRIWAKLANTPRVAAMTAKDRLTLVYQLGYSATPPASQQAYARRMFDTMQTAAGRGPMIAIGAPLSSKSVPHENKAGARGKAQLVRDPATPEAAPETSLPVPLDSDLSDHQQLQQTMAGGIVGLINLITAIGIPQADEAVEADIALSLIQRFLARLPDTEMMRDALPKALHDSADIAAWTCPKDLLAATPSHLRARRQGLLFGDGAVTGVPEHDRARALQNGLMIMLSRQLRHLTGQSWRHVLTRPALFAASQTHLDIIVDLDDVRIEERRLGLDLSPGWVPWLGRVVTLHFERFDGGGDIS